MGCHFLLQGIFPTQGSNPGLLHCRQILYCLSHQGSIISINSKKFSVGNVTHIGAHLNSCLGMVLSSPRSGCYAVVELGATRVALPVSWRPSRALTFASPQQSCISAWSGGTKKAQLPCLGLGMILKLNFHPRAPLCFFFSFFLLPEFHHYAWLPALPCFTSFDLLQVFPGMPSLNDHLHVNPSLESDTGYPGPTIPTQGCWYQNLFSSVSNLSLSLKSASYSNDIHSAYTFIHLPNVY